LQGTEFALQFGAVMGSSAPKARHQEERWVGGQGAGDTHPLALSARVHAGSVMPVELKATAGAAHDPLLDAISGHP
jgi:hypothetical protein